jgi:hypothetical protein
MTTDAISGSRRKGVRPNGSPTVTRPQIPLLLLLLLQHVKALPHLSGCLGPLLFGACCCRRR